jgi:long-subunit acyl-CoA synthetase (AMP-forming)
MAVPTIYAKMIEYFVKNVDQKSQTFFGKSFDEIRNICRKEIRLMVSGSAALPQVWKKFFKKF